MLFNRKFSWLMLQVALLSRYFAWRNRADIARAHINGISLLGQRWTLSWRRTHLASFDLYKHEIASSAIKTQESITTKKTLMNWVNSYFKYHGNMSENHRDNIFNDVRLTEGHGGEFWKKALLHNNKPPLQTVIIRQLFNFHLEWTSACENHRLKVLVYGSFF